MTASRRSRRRRVEIAEEACRRIKVTYEVLPAVFDALEAIAPGAPVIHDEPDTVGIFDAARNISHHIEGQTVSDEELDAAFASAYRVFEQTFQRSSNSTRQSSLTSRSAGSMRTSGSYCVPRPRCRSTCVAWWHRCSVCR